MLTHLLTSKGHVYAVRTAAGRYAKLALLAYYCKDAGTACVTFRYVYHGGARGGWESEDPRRKPAGGRKSSVVVPACLLGRRQNLEHPVPQTGHTPFRAGRPFAIFTCCGFEILRLPPCTSRQ